MTVRSMTVLAALALVVGPVALVGAQGDGSAGSQIDRETSRVTFYGHVFGHTLGAPMPANTEAPVGENLYGFGSFDWCTPVANAQGLPPLPSDTAGCEADQLNKLALFSTAGFVDVKDVTEFNQQGGYGLLHNERGQTKDIQLDQTKNIDATIYLTLDFHSWPSSADIYGTSCNYPSPPDVPCLHPYWGWDPGAQNDFVVKATLYTANLGAHGSDASEAPPVAEAIENGDAQIVAEGQFGPETIMNGLPGAPTVNEFTVDLGTPQVQTIPRDQDFFLVYSFYSETAGQAWGISSWRIWSGELFPPTFTLPVKNAFDVERVIPNFAHGKLAILGVMNTPWGSYDIDPSSVELAIEGPTGQLAPEHMQRFGDFSVAHGGHYLPINLTWIWDYRKDNVQPGTYEVTLSASNFQGSAQATCSATFQIQRATNGALAPGKVEEGICGAQSATDDFLDQLTQDAGTSPTGGS